MKILFIGKFQPPHLGHIITINLLKEKFGKVEIGITEGKPRLISQNKVKDIFLEVYKYDKKIKVLKLKGAVDENTLVIKEKYKYIISGNKKILHILKKKGHEVKFQPRSKGYLFSGRSLRKKILS